MTTVLLADAFVIGAYSAVALLLLLLLLLLVVVAVFGQLTLPYAVNICFQLACGLQHLHACGVLHRDLKTDNALVQALQPLVVKWADFGCSVKLAADSRATDDASTTSRTHTSSVQLGYRWSKRVLAQYCTLPALLTRCSKPVHTAGGTCGMARL